MLFIKDEVGSRGVSMKHCPRGMMWADVLTKPMQGLAFKKMSAALMNCEVDYSEDNCDNAKLIEGSRTSVETSPARRRSVLGEVLKLRDGMTNQERDRSRYDTCEWKSVQSYLPRRIRLI